MKIVSFFSLIMLLSLGFVACKDSSKSDPAADATSLENAMETAKADLVKNITDLQTTVGTKITETENQLATATEEAKADIQVKLDGLRTQKTNLENLSIKLSKATAETWSEFQKQAATVIDDVRIALK